MKKPISIFQLNKIKSLPLKQRKGVSDIIVTMLLMSITITAGVFVFTSFSGEGGIVDEVGSDVAPQTAIQLEAKLIGYDTRDSDNLSGISFIDNSGVTSLQDGEYILLKIRNPNNGPMTIDEVTINEEPHTWANSGAASLSGNLPSEGTFEVFAIDKTSPNIFTPAVVQPGADARIIISLEDDLTDIALNEVIRVTINAVGLDPMNFKIPAGSSS